MRLLLSNAGNVVPKETLLLKAWGYDSQAEDNHVEVYISFLRKSCFISIAPSPLSPPGGWAII